jgi:Glyoxalase-like domain
MSVRWITAFLDSPSEDYRWRLDFWCQITASTPSTPRGSTGEFVTLIPPNGDAYLRAQRAAQGPGGIHLDLHVENVKEFVDHAIALGANVLADRGYVVLASPGKFVFCAVNWHGEVMRPQPIGQPASLVDQICLDVPFEVYQRECEFWTALTSWELTQSMRAEFCFLTSQDGLPLRLLLQRLEPTDSREEVTAHLDIACGRGIDDLLKQHSALGAELAYSVAAWSTLCDPAGFQYCLTSREPAIGLLSGSDFKPTRELPSKSPGSFEP